MKWKFWEKQVLNPLLDDVKFIRADRLDRIIDDNVRRLGKLNCLDIGTGHDDGEKFTTVDIDPDCNPDIVGDIRCLFAPSPEYVTAKSSYPGLNRLSSGSFQLVRMKHVIEHIEWIYWPAMFDWLASILVNGGMLIVDTPNLVFISKVYLLGVERQEQGLAPRFPADEHPDLMVSQQHDLQRWTNFKLYSGCSTGDYHHGCMDVILLMHYLTSRNFERVLAFNGPSLRAVAFKGEDPSVDLDKIISQYLQD